MHQPDQRAPGRQAGNEALGAVDRVEHPDVFGVRPVLPVFLADDAMGGKSLGDQPSHRRFGGAVGLGDGIEHAAARLVLGADGGAEERQDHFARDLRETLDEAAKSTAVIAGRSSDRMSFALSCISAMSKFGTVSAHAEAGASRKPLIV